MTANTEIVLDKLLDRYDRAQDKKPGYNRHVQSASALALGKSKRNKVSMENCKNKINTPSCRSSVKSNNNKV